MKSMMISLKTTISALILIMAFSTTSCAQNERSHEEDGEESGKQFLKSEVCEEVRKGTKLIIRYDEAVLAFVGTVENISTKVIKKVRVEVHLSNGVELGPTKKVNLVPGEKVEIKLSAVDQKFESWSTHAEAGNSEHGERESNGEHR